MYAFIYVIQVSVAAKNILTKCPGVHSTLQDLEAQLQGLCDSFDELATASGLSAKSRRNAWIDVKVNRTRVTEARLTAMENLQAVETDCSKIKAAMLW